jgi:RNA polymerase sigma-70 factor (ECF subfamily)
VSEVAQSEPAPDRPDFDALYAEYYDSLCRYVARHFGPQIAEEVAQEAMARLFQHRYDVRTWNCPWSWLKTVARRIAIDVRRAEKVCSPDDLALLEHEIRNAVGSAEDIAVERNTQDLVRTALARLHPTHQRVIVMRHFEGRTAEEVASLLGVTANAVRQRLFRAHHQLRVEMRHVLDRSYLGALHPILRLGHWLRRHLAATASRIAGAAGALGLALVLSIGLGVLDMRTPQGHGGDGVRPGPTVGRAAAEQGKALALRRPARVGAARRKIDRARPSATAGRATSADRPPAFGVVTKLPHKPLAPNDEDREEVWLDTPAGRVRLYSGGKNGSRPGALCGSGIVRCE